MHQPKTAQAGPQKVSTPSPELRKVKEKSLYREFTLQMLAHMRVVETDLQLLQLFLQPALR